MKKTNKTNQTENLSDNDLQNVAGGEEVSSFRCSTFQTIEECLRHFGCTWNSKRNNCFYELM